MSEAHPEHPAGGHQSGIRGLMTKKIGGMSAGFWIVGIGGGLAIAYYLRSHSSASDATAAAVDGADYDATTDGTGGAATSEPGYFGSGSDSTYGAGVGSDTDTTGDYTDTGDGADLYSSTPTSTDAQQAVARSRDPKSNSAWRNKAIAALVAKGYAGTRATQTVDAFLGGGKLSRSQIRLVNHSIAAIGAPPKATPKIVHKPEHAPKGVGHDPHSNGHTNVGTPPTHVVKPNQQTNQQGHGGTDGGRRDVGHLQPPAPVKHRPAPGRRRG